MGVARERGQISLAMGCEQMMRCAMRGSGIIRLLFGCISRGKAEALAGHGTKRKQDPEM